jgi:[acyl-carrier-protein] S-malonyltransferase
MARKVLLLFPGQGSQYVGMGRELCQEFPTARETFEEASQVLGEDLVKLCFDGPEEQLRLTANTQPAILTLSVALWRVLRESVDVRPSFAAGHSLGEYCALVAAGSLDFADAVRLVRRRGQLMQSAVPEGVGAMAAILGLDEEVVEDLCRQWAQGEVVAAANYNSRDQVVISGHAQAVRRVSRQAEKMGAKKVIPLPVSAPFHCRLMEEAGQRLRPYLEEVTFRRPAFPVISNVEAKPYNSEEEIPELLFRQVSHPVQWWRSMEYVASMGVDLAVELGPKKVLLGLLRRTAPQIKGIQAEDPKGLKQVAAALSS